MVRLGFLSGAVVLGFCVAACSSSNASNASTSGSGSGTAPTPSGTAPVEPEPAPEPAPVDPQSFCSLDTEELPRCSVRECTDSGKGISADKKVQLCTPDAEVPEKLKANEKVNGFTIVDIEVWPYTEKAPAYPDDIVWTYKDASAQAKACLAASRARLVDILTNDPPQELLDFQSRTKVSAFYNWNNDYTLAKKNQMASKSYQRMWLFEGRLMKWISETNQDGSCMLPTREALIAFAKACTTDVFPNCGPGK